MGTYSFVGGVYFEYVKSGTAEFDRMIATNYPEARYANVEVEKLESTYWFVLYITVILRTQRVLQRQNQNTPEGDPANV